MKHSYFFRYVARPSNFIPKGATSSYQSLTYLCITVDNSTGNLYYIDVILNSCITNQLKTKRWEI